MDDPASFIIFWIFIGAVVGGLIGASRNNVGSGVVWGALLGPIGWILVLFLDERAKCPECKSPVPDDARRCGHCGFDLYGRHTPKPDFPKTQSQTNVIGIEPDMKKCPFCAESIKNEAIKCRYCGSDLLTVPKKTEAERQHQKDEMLNWSPGAELKSSASDTIEGESISCPVCGQQIAFTILKKGENFCPHCSGKFIAE